MKNQKFIYLTIFIIIGSFLGSSWGRKFLGTQKVDEKPKYTYAYDLDRSSLPNGKTRLSYFYKYNNKEYKRVQNILPDDYSYKALYLVKFPKNKPQKGKILLDSPFQRLNKPVIPIMGWDSIPTFLIPLND